MKQAVNRLLTSLIHFSSWFHAITILTRKQTTEHLFDRPIDESAVIIVGLIENLSWLPSLLYIIIQILERFSMYASTQKTRKRLHEWSYFQCYFYYKNNFKSYSIPEHRVSTSISIPNPGSLKQTTITMKQNELTLWEVTQAITRFLNDRLRVI